MTAKKKIMVAIGFSDYAEGIFSFAADLAGQMDADLVVASIINERDVNAVRQVATMGFEVDGEHYVSGIKAERKQQLDDLITNTGIDPQRVHPLFKVGNPIDELLKIAVSQQVDLMVMGLKGRTDLPHVYVGSVADKIFRRSPVTIVSYRGERVSRHLRKRIHT